MLVENRPTVSSELFEDEAVIVNLENGNYYSYSASGIDVWKFLKNGVELAELKKKFSDKYGFDSSQETEFEQLILNLKEEGLVVETNEKSDSLNDQITFRYDQFTSPALNKFTDMQDLLLLDPIHDVDATGWPMQKEGATEENNLKKDGE